MVKIIGVAGGVIFLGLVVHVAKEVHDLKKYYTCVWPKGEEEW